MKHIRLTGYPNPVLVESIVWLEGDANYTRVHYQNGALAIVTQPLHWFEHHLDFIRVHRSAIINPRYITEFSQQRGRSGWVRLVTGQVISVSRTRLEQTSIRLQ